MCGTSYMSNTLEPTTCPWASPNVASSRPTESVKMPRVSTDQRTMGAFSMTVPSRASGDFSKSPCHPRSWSVPSKALVLDEHIESLEPASVRGAVGDERSRTDVEFAECADDGLHRVPRA